MGRKGTIFDIKKFAVHDGPGIRSTVFFKGCPLRCLWCQNPEGILPSPAIMVFSSRCIRGCRDCIAVCPHHALSKGRRGILLDRSRCDGCGDCARACPSEALLLTGRSVTANDVLRELAKDKPFFQDSGGGVTISGGEPLQQPGFLRELLALCRGQKIHTAVDTSGHAPFAEFEKLFPLVDLFLYDLKALDEDRHKRLTGVSNRLILGNLRKLSRAGCALAVRVPLVPGFNDDPRDLEQMADFCASLPNRHPLHLLPYHRGYSGKARRLGLGDPLPKTLPPAPEAVRQAKEIFLKNKLTVKIGG